MKLAVPVKQLCEAQKVERRDFRTPRCFSEGSKSVKSYERVSVPRVMAEEPPRLAN